MSKRKPLPWHQIAPPSLVFVHSRITADELRGGGGAPISDAERAQLRVGELGRFDGAPPVPRQATPEESKAYADARRAMEETDERIRRKQRAMRERAVAHAIAQPQGLGLLFAGLRPRGQR